MCRWLAYSGSPIALEEVLFKPAHSLVVQSLRATQGVHPTNGDGFGLGWYGAGGLPRLYRSISPAWNDRNLRELAADVRSPLFLAHVRASTGGAVQQSNCHPFRHGKWLWMHNGQIREFPKLKRELALAVDASLYPAIEGTTDSELMFFLALTFGLDQNPVEAVERMAGLVEGVGLRSGVENPLQMTLAVSDGKNLWIFRYSSGGKSGTLFYSTDLKTLRHLYPENPDFAGVDDCTRLVVSEPFADLPGAWNEIPEASCGLVGDGMEMLQGFEPRASRVAVPA